MSDFEPLDIRPLEVADLDQLLALYRELHQDDAPLPEPSLVQSAWYDILHDPRMHSLGGFLEHRLVTGCQLVIVPNLTRGCRPYGLIENVVTSAYHRNHGHASELLAHALSVAWQHNCYKVMLMTGRKDEATLHFYESAGFDRHAKQAFYAAAPD